MYNFTLEEILKAIKDSSGIMSIIAKRLDCSWTIAKDYVEKYEESQTALKDEKEKNLDKAESVILKSLQEDDVQTAKWYLTTIGKYRGYTEKQEISLTTKKENMTKDELEKLKEEIKGLIENEINEK